MIKKNLTIGNKEYSSYHNPYFIAEVSANHGKSLEKTFTMIDASKAAGANAVKLQTFTAETITFDSQNSDYIVKNNAWEGQSLHQLYERAHLPWEMHAAIFEYCAKIGIDCFSTPFDFTAIDFLKKFNPPAYKIASSELIDLPLISRVAKQGKPIIISTGMGNSNEIWDAINTVRAVDLTIPIVLLKCTAEYPSKVEDANIGALREEFPQFECHTGLSDHSPGSVVPVVAALSGVVVIEKHITLSRDEGGIDSHFSMEPHEFLEMTCAVKSSLAAAQNFGIDKITTGEQNSKKYRKSLIFVKNMAVGEVTTPENVKILRPSIGIEPKFYDNVLGLPVQRTIRAGDPVKWTDFENDR